MKRPVGVMISGFLQVAGGALCLTLGSLQYAALRGRVIPVEDSGHTTYFVMYPWALYLPLVIFGGMGAWSLVTGVGVLWLRRWARISTLLLASLLATMGAMGIPTIYALDGTHRAEMDAAAWQMIRTSLISFYVVLGAVGVWWLIYFNRPKVKEAFRAAPEDASKPECPTSITLIAWLLLSFLLFAPMAIWWRPPANLLGITFAGAAATVWNLILMFFFAYCGWGLLKLRPAAWKHTMILSAFLVVNSACLLLLPDAYNQYQRAMLDSVPRFPDQFVQPIADKLSAGFFLILSLGVPIWFLWTRRERYLAAAGAANPQNSK
jgi:hypothetical protein